MDEKAARNVGSWATDADGASPGDPPAGWSGGGGDHKVHPDQEGGHGKRKQTRQLGDVRGPTSTGNHRKSSFSGRLAIEALADGGWHKRFGFWATHISKWKLATILVVRLAFLTHCCVLMAWFAYASAWTSGDGLEDFESRDIAGVKYGKDLCSDGHENTTRAACEFDGNTYDGGRAPSYAYKMRILSICTFGSVTS